MGISITQLLIILAIVIVLFGTKRLRTMGSDFGSAIKSFRSAVKEGGEVKEVSKEADDTKDEAATKQQETTEK